MSPVRSGPARPRLVRELVPWNEGPVPETALLFPRLGYHVGPIQPLQLLLELLWLDTDELVQVLGQLGRTDLLERLGLGPASSEQQGPSGECE